MMPIEERSSLNYWRELAHAEQKRGDNLEFENGELRSEINLMRRVEKSQAQAHRNKLKRCGVSDVSTN